jgi:N-acetylmuramoyl-L-alanine amidase
MIRRGDDAALARGVAELGRRQEEIGLGRRAVLRLACLTAGGLAFSGVAAAAPETRVRSRRAASRHTVVLDAGHGGIDPGAIGVSGVYEKDLTIEVARDVARLLEGTRRYNVVLTRDDDEFIPLRERVARARAANADLFISIHADALPNAAMRGASVFTLSEKASDKEAAALAARENQVDLIGGIDLSRHPPEVGTILLDLTRRQTANLSIGLARRLVAELGKDVPLLEHSHRSAGFAVLKAPDIPSALVEMGCLSNAQEERLLRSNAYQKKIARLLVHAIDGYFDTVLKA